MVNYGWKWSFVTLLDAEVTVHVLTANNDVNLVKTWTGWLLNHCLVLIEYTNSTTITCIWQILSLVCPLKYKCTTRHCFYLIDPKDCLQRWWVLWIRSIERIWYVLCYYFPKQGYSLWFIARLPKQHIGLYVVTRLC